MGIIKNVLDLFFPPRCVFCRKFLRGGGGGICVRCQETLPFTSGPGATVKGEFFDQCVSPLYYRGAVRASILRFKFKGATAYVNTYADILADCVKDRLDGRYDVITWVPISARREKTRGYDQSMLLALATALRLDDVAIETVCKQRDVPAQSTLTGAEKRRANVSGVYTVSDPELVAGKRVLLIDDIVTTGATLAECTRTLLMAGAESVVCAALARAD